MDPECQFPEYLEELPEPEVFAGLDDSARNSPEKFTGDSLRRLLALSIALISYGDAQQIVKRIEAADGGTVEAALEADGITAEAAGLARGCPDWLRLVIAPLLEEIASGPDSEWFGECCRRRLAGGQLPGV